MARNMSLVEKILMKLSSSEFLQQVVLKITGGKKYPK